MKKNFATWILMGCLGFPAYSMAEPRLIFLVEPDDHEMISLLEDEGLGVRAPRNENEMRALEDQFNDGWPDLGDRYKRIMKLIEMRQEEFIQLVDRFLEADFFPEDPEASPYFMALVGEITKRLFQSESEQIWWDRLYVIYSSYRKNLDEYGRFHVLDQALRDEDLRLLERRKLWTEVLSISGAVVGAAAVGYLSFMATQKMLPIAKTELSLGLILKWASRGGFIIIGAGVGAYAGARIGFLGGDALMSRGYTLPRTRDGAEDLKQILDAADSRSRPRFRF
ncbi:MAG: hypothetical protein EA369_03705 [Bradymonadales bacterium]|nr:MAG: hypothetical protein EA369_03705 [Bradymonadales bacterium]